MNRVCYIIGAGDLSVGSIPYDKEKGDFLIVADGGLMYCPILEVEPDLIVGDFDSLDEEYQEIIEELEKTVPQKVMRLPREKDETDMMHAIQQGLALGYQQFRLYGANGGRLDHTLANIQLLQFLKNQGAVGYIMDGTGMMLMAQNETVSFRQEMEGYVSVFSHTTISEGVHIKGLKYEVEQVSLSNANPLGISNEFIGEKAEITVEQGSLLILISWPE